MFRLFAKRHSQEVLAFAGHKAASLILDSAQSGFSIYDTNLEDIDAAVRGIVDCQMMVVSLARHVGDLSLQDAYYDSGLAGPFSAPPKRRYHADDERILIRQAVRFLPTAKSNVDMRFRYVVVSELCTPAEQGLWQMLERWTSNHARKAFEQRKPLSSGWVGFIERLSAGDVPSAKAILESF